jgi:hypothetical protein
MTIGEIEMNFKYANNVTEGKVNKGGVNPAPDCDKPDIKPSGQIPITMKKHDIPEAACNGVCTWKDKKDQPPLSVCSDRCPYSPQTKQKASAGKLLTEYIDEHVLRNMKSALGDLFYIPQIELAYKVKELEDTLGEIEATLIVNSERGSLKGWKYDKGKRLVVNLYDVLIHLTKEELK